MNRSRHGEYRLPIVIGLEFSGRRTAREFFFFWMRPTRWASRRRRVDDEPRRCRVVHDADAALLRHNKQVDAAQVSIYPLTGLSLSLSLSLSLNLIDEFSVDKSTTAAPVGSIKNPTFFFRP